MPDAQKKAAELIGKMSEQELSFIHWHALEMYVRARNKREVQRLLNLIDDYKKTAKNKAVRKELKNLLRYAKKKMSIT